MYIKREIQCSLLPRHWIRLIAHSLQKYVQDCTSDVYRLSEEMLVIDFCETITTEISYKFRFNRNILNCSIEKKCFEAYYAISSLQALCLILQSHMTWGPMAFQGTAWREIRPLWHIVGEHLPMEANLVDYMDQNEYRLLGPGVVSRSYPERKSTWNCNRSSLSEDLLCSRICRKCLTLDTVASNLMKVLLATF